MTEGARFRRADDGLSITEYVLRWSGVVGVLLLAALVIETKPYSSHGALGYALGVVGLTMMLVLFGYPLRKRLRFLGSMGPMRHWFRLHMVAGVLGPILILFHATFNVESVNAAVALACMLLVAISGLVGRYLYRGIHYGLYGRRASAEDIRKSFQISLADLSPKMWGLERLEHLLHTLLDWIEHPPPGSLHRVYHFLAMEGRRRQTERRARSLIRALKRRLAADNTQVGLTISELDPLMTAFSRTCAAQQRAAQFLVFERLFALWHVIHLPFIYLFLLTTITHVVAVHVY